MYVHGHRFVYSAAAAMVGLAIMVLVPGCKTGSTSVGAERGACYPNGTCNAGLVCMSDLCVKNVVPAGEKVVPGVKNVVPVGMALIPAGSFWMGCNEAVDTCTDRFLEMPYHQVTLSAYYMDRTEVTIAQYAECVTAGSCAAPRWRVYDDLGGNHPVIGVTWTQARDYCARAGKRLPTEAEWEKAARGTDGRKYPWGNETATCEYAVMDDGGNGCGTKGPWAVCSKSPAGDSPYGLCDMAGNVAEWVSDWYVWNYYNSSPAPDPTGPDSGEARVFRGGSFSRDDYFLRAYRRNLYVPSDALINLGFRCAKDAP